MRSKGLSHATTCLKRNEPNRWKGGLGVASNTLLKDTDLGTGQVRSGAHALLTGYFYSYTRSFFIALDIDLCSLAAKDEPLL